MTTKKAEPTSTTVTHPTIEGVSYDVPVKDVGDWTDVGWKTATNKGDDPSI